MAWSILLRIELEVTYEILPIRRWHHEEFPMLDDRCADLAILHGRSRAEYAGDETGVLAPLGQANPGPVGPRGQSGVSLDLL